MIEFRQVSKRYGGQIVLDAVSFQVNARERAGFVGPNGAGKSTVFAMIAGDMEPDSGSVECARDIRLGYLRQQIRTADASTPLRAYVEGAAADLIAMQAEMHDLTDRLHHGMPLDQQPRALHRLGELQSAFEHRGGYELHARASATLTGLGFAADQLDRPLGEFSGGWQMRAELSRALVADPDLLLLDEPSNYLDLPAVEWLQRFLADYRGTLALISHDRYLLNTLTEVIYEVAAGAVTRYPGNYAWYAEERVRRREQTESARKNQQRKRDEVERFVNRFRSQANKATQVQSRIKMLDRMEKVEPLRVVRGRGALRLAPPPHGGAEVIRLEDAGFSYDGTHWVLRGVNLSIQRGDKLAVVGWNGMGKTTLLRLLAGHLEPSEGKRLLGHKIVPGYQSQEFADTMDPSRTALETLKAVAPDASEREVRTLLGGFGFSGEAADKSVSILSGGEKVRLAFARLLIRPPNLLLLDEPTTHLDLDACEALQEALRNYEGTVVLVSHDVEFVRAVAKGILAMTPGGITRYAGDYDYYRQKIAEQAVPDTADSPRARGPNDSKTARRERADQRQALRQRTKDLDRTIQQAEKQIEALEKEQAVLHERLANPDVAPAVRAEAGRRLKLLEPQLAEHLQAWEKALAQREEVL